MPKPFRLPEHVTLYEAAKRVGLHKRSRSNWNPLIEMLCASAKPPIFGRNRRSSSAVPVGTRRHIGA